MDLRVVLLLRLALPFGRLFPSMEIISRLLDAGVNPNPIMNFHRPNAPGRGRFQDNQISTGTTALFRAAQNNDTEVIQALRAKLSRPVLWTGRFRKRTGFEVRYRQP